MKDDLKFWPGNRESCYHPRDGGAVKAGLQGQTGSLRHFHFQIH